MKRILTIISAMALTFSAFAQQALVNSGPVVSPEINADGTVTFRYLSVKAESVQVSGDFLPNQKIQTPAGEYEIPGVADMKKVDNGLWQYTTPEAVEPEFYNYFFVVDGNRELDLNNVFVNRDVATLTSVLLVPGPNVDATNDSGYLTPGKVKADLYAIQDVPHGTVSKVWYHSDVAGFDRRMTIYTPAEYDGVKRFPVVYILHGMGGDEDAWVTQGRATQILDNLIAKGLAEPMIAVFPNGNISQEAAPLENATNYDRPTMSLPNTMDGKFETSFPEIINFVDSHYQTLADKHHRAVCGLSMGGFHTLYLTINYPDTFDYSGMFSSAIGNFADLSVSDLYSDLDGKLATYYSKNPALLWVGCGSSDFLYEQNKEFRETLDKGKYPYTYVETSGGHIWKNWRIYLSDFLPLLFK